MLVITQSDSKLFIHIVGGTKDAKVGKSTLVYCAVKDFTFDDIKGKQMTSPMYDFDMKIINEPLKVLLLEVATVCAEGSPIARAIEISCNAAPFFLFTYAVDDAKSLDAVHKYWYPKLAAIRKSAKKAMPPCILLGLKADLTAAVTQKDVLACAKAIGALHVAVCDATAMRPRQVIQDIVKVAYTHLDPTERDKKEKAFCLCS